MSWYWFWTLIWATMFLRAIWHWKQQPQTIHHLTRGRWWMLGSICAALCAILSA